MRVPSRSSAWPLPLLCPAPQVSYFEGNLSVSATPEGCACLPDCEGTSFTTKASSHVIDWREFCPINQNWLNPYRRDFSIALNTDEVFWDG